MQRVLKEETTGCHPARILSPKNKLNSDQKEPKISTQAGENGDHAVKSAGIRTHMLRASCSHDLIASHAPVLEPRSRHGGAPATGQSFPTLSYCCLRALVWWSTHRKFGLGRAKASFLAVAHSAFIVLDNVCRCRLVHSSLHFIPPAKLRHVCLEGRKHRSTVRNISPA